ncbi:Pfs, NACHT and ankyrin domain protein [Mycena leptocephala]|nr:Pfs, NACHT and ankyrin domain protein [Mycena leptocephala]
MAQNQFLELWKDATREYEDETKITIATHPLAHCNSPDAVLDALDRDLQKFKHYRDRKEGLRKWLKPMLHLIASLSEIAGGAAGVPVPFATAGFIALGVLVQAAKNVSARYDCIMDLCELLHSFLERLRVYTSTQLPTSMRGVGIRMLVHLLSVFALVTKEIEHTRIGSYLRTLMGRKDVQEALKKLNDLIGAEQSMGVANAMAFSREILDHVQGLVRADQDAAIVLAHLKNDLHKAIQYTEDANERVLQRLRDLTTCTIDAQERLAMDLGELSRRHLDSSVRSWLKAPDSCINHNAARELHDSDTGSWLWKAWVLTACCFSALNSLPFSAGSGKTIISTVIEDVLAMSGSVLAYFYFYHGEAEKQSLRGMLSSIISQLEEQLLVAPSPLLALYKKCGSGAHEPSIWDLTTCLKSLIIALSAPSIFIILDALDESSTPSDLKDVLCHLVQCAEGRTHIFVTSRPEDTVIKVLRPLTTCELDLSSVIYDDISVYLHRAVSQEHPFCSWKPVHRERVLNHLLEHSNGMFRWVACQLNDLRECLLQDLQDMLNTLPTTLDATYERILSRITARNKPHARRLFNWLAFSFRSLHVEELAQVLAIRFTSDASATFEEDCVEADPAVAISRVCLSLVHITPVGIVQFAHFSVKEFFLSERIQCMPSISLFRIEAETAHTIIAATCLAYLLWIGSIVNIPYDADEGKLQFPLEEYSVQYAVHAQFDRVSDNVRGMLVPLFNEDAPEWTFWVSHVEREWEVRNRPPSGVVERHLEPARLLLEHGADVNAQGGQYWTALQAASAEGHLELARLLLEHGAEVNAQGGEDGNALQAASSGGRLEVARLLLEHGAEVNVQGGQYWTALQAASAEGHLELARLLLEHGAEVNAQGWSELARLLLEHGAEVNAQGGRCGNLLYDASSGGDLELVRLLLDHGAEVNAQSGGDTYAIEGASTEGHLEVARLLLEHGADVNAQDGEGTTALHGASVEGHLELAQLLLEHGAEVNVQEGVDWTALQAASSGGHLELARLLLEHGADVNAQARRLLLEHGAEVNAQGGQYWTALQAASSGGYLELARLLLEHGAEINAQGGQYWTALQAASSGGYLELAQLLLEHGAEVNVQGGQYWTALQAASAEGHLEVARLLLEHGAELARLLLEHGADVNAQGGERGNALQAAVSEGWSELARLLLEQGADVNAQGGQYWTALQATSAEGHLEVARLLLEHGVDVNAQGGQYWTALQAASAEGHLELARLLLEHGAEVNAQGGEDGNALQAASSGGRLEVARLLLEHGAEVNAQGGQYWTALQAASTEGHLEVARLLLEHGAEVNASGGEDGNALQAASSGGRLELARLLLEHGADINAQGGQYWTALQAASVEGHLELAGLLLEHAAEVNAQGGEDGNTVQAASSGGHLEPARLLLEHVHALGGDSSD